MGPRFPTFFSVDAQFIEIFICPAFDGHGGRHKVRVGLYSINLTNHGNFREVVQQRDSPFFGSSLAFSAAWMVSSSFADESMVRIRKRA